MSLGPRADFECHACRTLWRDLSIRVPVCPSCGEGGKTWRRLYNTVQVSTRGHRIARFVDRPLQQQYDAYTALQDRQRRVAQHVQEAADRAWERADPAERQAQVQLGIDRQTILREGISAIPLTGPSPVTGAALLARDPAARAASAAYTAPVLERVRVVPQPVVVSHGR
jgi:hypothetical protein